MDSYVDRSQPYPIRVPVGQSAGELHVGWRSYPINVVDISWQTITIAVTKKIAARIRHHSKATVWNQGNQWLVIVEGHPQQHENGLVTLSLNLADREDPRLKQIQRSTRGASVQIGTQRMGTDPVVVAVMIIGILIALLVTPGWGEQWGTSVPLTKAITELFSSFFSLFTNLF